MIVRLQRVRNDFIGLKVIRLFLKNFYNKHKIRRNIIIIVNLNYIYIYIYIYILFDYNKYEIINISNMQNNYLLFLQFCNFIINNEQ